MPGRKWPGLLLLVIACAGVLAIVGAANPAPSRVQRPADIEAERFADENLLEQLNVAAAGQSRDGQALEWITSTLRRGTVPAEFRAALYKTAAEIPGVTITEEQATLNGKTGVAIGRLETASNTRRDLIIDPATGQFIGEREVILDESAGVPAGTVTASSAVTTTVVDAAPADAALCGNHR